MSEKRAVTFSAQEAADYLGISYWLILELVKRKQIPCTDLGRRKLFRKETLDNWMTQREQMTQIPEDTQPEGYGTLRKVRA